VPRFCLAKGKVGLSAEYGMLPAALIRARLADKAGKLDGAIGRDSTPHRAQSRAVINLDKLGERTLWVDCDVLERRAAHHREHQWRIRSRSIDALATLKGEIAPLKEIVRDSVAATALACLKTSNCSDLEYRRRPMPRSISTW